MINKYKIKVDPKLLDFINNEVLADLQISEEKFWSGFSDIVDIFFPQNVELINKRKDLQKALNKWHKNNKSKEVNIEDAIDSD